MSFDVNLIEFFEDIPLFSVLSQNELRELMHLAEPFAHSAGHRLFEEGETPTGVFLIERGEVEVRIRRSSGRELILALFGNGSLIGEMAFIDGGPRSASVDAVSQTQGYIISREQFENMRTEGNPTAYKIILELARTLDERRHQLEQRINQLQQDPELEARLAERPTKELIAQVRKG